MAFTIVQSATSSASTLVQSNTAGNALFIGGRFVSGQIISSITDTQFNLWKNVSFVKNGNIIYMWMCQSCKGGANTITINGGTISFYLYNYLEISNNIPGITVVDSAHATQIGSGTGAAFTTQPIRLTGSGGDLVLGLVANETANSLTINNFGSFTQSTNVSGNTFLFYILNDTNASESFGGTYSSAVSWECLIVAFKRVPVLQGAGIWVDQSTVVAAVSADQPGQPNVFYEAGAVILTPNADGKIFKMIFGTTNGTCYAESNNGTTWTRSGSNPIVAAGAHDYPRVFKNGSTYYLYTGVLAGPVKAYTASALNGPYTLQNASAIAITQNWETAANFIGQLCVTGQVAGTWHGYYAALSDAYFNHNYAMGHVTSTDLLTWTKDTNNPTLVMEGVSQLVNCRLINGVYYAYSQIVQPGIPSNATGGSIPNDVGRLSATSPAGPWSLWPTATSYRTILASEGMGTTKGQWADPWTVEALGNVYTYTSIAVDGTTAATTIGCAIAFNATLAQLVQTNEGVLNTPLISDAGLAIQLNALATDPFSGGDANPIGGNWTQLYTGAAFSPAQRASNFYEGTVAGNNSDSYYNAITWPNDQWVSFTVGALTDLNCFVGADLRTTPGAFASANGYRIFVQGPIGATAICSILKYVNGTPTTLASKNPFTVAVGDIFTVSAISTQISVYQNGNLFLNIVDSSQTSGQAGILATPSVAAGVTGARISSFSGGSLASFTLPPASGTSFDIMFRGRLYVTRVVSGL